MRRFILTFAALVVALGGVVAVASPALAAPIHCASSMGQIRVCVFDTVDMNQGKYYWTNPAVGLCYSVGAPWNTKVTAASNMLNWGGTLKRVSFYNNTTCSGAGLVTNLSGTNNYSSSGPGRWWANCLNGDLWGGTYGPPATWVTGNSSCASPNVRSFKVFLQ